MKERGSVAFEQQKQRRIVEITQRRPAVTSPELAKKVEDEDPPVKIPLELWPVIKTLVGYGKRIHSLGAMRGARALEQLASQLEQLALDMPEVKTICATALLEASQIRAGIVIEDEA